MFKTIRGEECQQTTFGELKSWDRAFIPLEMPGEEEILYLAVYKYQDSWGSIEEDLLLEPSRLEKIKEALCLTEGYLLSDLNKYTSEDIGSSRAYKKRFNGIVYKMIGKEKQEYLVKRNKEFKKLAQAARILEMVVMKQPFYDEAEEANDIREDIAKLQRKIELFELKKLN